MFCKRRLLQLFYLLVVVVSGCTTSSKKGKLFTLLSPSETGIHFNNVIEETDSTKSFINEFGYMGGGVGIGDFNNDGLKDIFFSGNQVSSRLYINKGNNTFEDVTEKAGLTTKIWATGVSVVDINNDGYDDLYVCSFGKDLKNSSKNLLFINQHNLTFTEQANAYKLADTSYSSQAAFFDYDKDGDLDMYLMNYMLNGPSANTIMPRDLSGNSIANDKLYRNDGDSFNVGHPVFTNVTLQANIKEDGYGLGLVITDVNNDNWPDIYVGNDFVSNDVLWLNNHDGTFTNCIGKALQHQSYSSMGADAADINNDGWTDIATLDMLPEYNERKKTSYSIMNYSRYEAERIRGYEPEFMRNMLQVNNGTHTDGKTNMPFFSEIGQLAGISATDWSWSVLIADFDNDSWKDMHITNGIGRDFINADFLDFSNDVLSKSFGNIDEQRKLIREKLASLKHITLQNYLYLNNGDYTFKDVSADAGIGEASMSNGAAYADLDNDGDLDLVVNNINAEAFVLLNNATELSEKKNNHYLKINLQGNSGNLNGYGSKVLVYSGGQVQMQEQSPVKGYLSSVDQELLFGLGKLSKIDSVVITWPNDKVQVLTQLRSDSTYTFFQKDAALDVRAQAVNTPALFSSASAESNINYYHQDNNYNDFDVQRLLPQKFSQLGPFIASGDVNGDGLIDFFVGGALNVSGKVFMQQAKGTFVSHDLTAASKMEEDAACMLFDSDNDGDLDLLITHGETSYQDTSVYHLPHLYHNDGKGNFSRDKQAIPATVRTIGGCVTTGDYDGDGDLDVFIGGRVSGKYPVSPNSYLLQNNNGIFTDVTKTACPELQKAGMVTAAVWTDFDNNKQQDLVITGEYMPVRFFKNQNAKLVEVTAVSMGLENMNGMWRSLTTADVDNDGDLDLVAGNLGLNCRYDVSPEQPMKLFVSDIDGNGSIDPVMFYYTKNQKGKKELYPSISRSQFAEQVPAIKKSFLLHKDYAEATFDKIYSGAKKDNLQTFTCNETRTCWLENTGNGKFVKHVLPVEAQFAPVNAIVCTDVDGDGINDLLLAGNEYQTEVMTGRYDASYGCFLKGTGKNGFVCVPPAKSGFMVKGDVKDLKMITTSKKEMLLLAAVNNDTMRVFKVRSLVGR